MRPKLPKHAIYRVTASGEQWLYSLSGVKAFKKLCIDRLKIGFTGTGEIVR